jgi:hypothetical protein
LPLVVDRRYQSLDRNGGQSLASRWMLSSFDRGLYFVDNQPTAIFYEVDAGYWVPFFADVANPSGGFLSPPGLDARLVQNQDGTYTLTWQRTGVREDYAAAGGLPTWTCPTLVDR